jgi:hypothetical protein
MQNLITLAEKLYSFQPLLKVRPINFKNEFDKLSNEAKIDFLVYCFKRYDIGFTESVVLYLPCLWENFSVYDWKSLIKKMFPRQLDFNKFTIKNINTGWYTDIRLLNGIIGINPFEFIFDELEINENEKQNVFEFLKYRGKHSFYVNEKELIEKVTDFYDLEIFQKINKMKQKLLKEGFYTAIKYNEVIKTYNIFERKNESQNNFYSSFFTFFDGLKKHSATNQYNNWLSSTDFSIWSNSYVEVNNKKIFIIKENVKTLSSFSHFSKQELELLVKQYQLEIKEENGIFYAYTPSHDSRQLEISKNEELTVIYAIDGDRAPESIFIYGIFENND